MPTDDTLPRGVQTSMGQPTVVSHVLMARCHDCGYIQIINYDTCESFSAGYDDALSHAENKKHNVIVLARKGFEIYDQYIIECKPKSIWCIIDNSLRNWFYKHRKLVNVFGCLFWLNALLNLIFSGNGPKTFNFWTNIFVIFCWSFHLGIQLWFKTPEWWEKIYVALKKRR